MQQVYHSFLSQILELTCLINGSELKYSLSQVANDIQSAYANDHLTYQEYETLTEKLLNAKNEKKIACESDLINTKFVEFSERVKSLNSKDYSNDSFKSLLNEIRESYENGELSDTDFDNLIYNFPQNDSVENELPEENYEDKFIKQIIEKKNI